MEENKQKSSSGIIVSGSGEIKLNEFDTTDFFILLEDYYKMRNGDSIASSSLQILKLPLLSIDFRIEGKNEELNNYIEQQLRNLDKGFLYFIRHILLALDFGFILFEKVWEKGKEYKGKITNVLKKLVPIQHLTIEQFYYNDYGEFIGIKHKKINSDGSYIYIDIMKDELLEMVWDEEFSDIRGRSLLRTSRLVWKAKQDVLIGTTRAKVRGAGIPKITIRRSDEEVLSKAKIIGSTLANSTNSYVIQGEDEMDVELLQLQNQNDNVEYLQYLDRQQFFNTLSQFMTSGIGENGSRAATQAHKSPYESFINNIANWIENKINDELIKDIVDNSYFIISNNDYPKLKFNLSKSIDIGIISDSLMKLVNINGIKLEEQDKVYLRDILGLPKKKDINNKIDTIDTNDNNEKNDDEDTIDTNEKNDDEKFIEEDYNHNELILDINKLNLSKMSNKAREIFELENAIKVHNTIRQQVNKIVNYFHNKILNDAAKQLEKTNGQDYYLKYKKQLTNEIRKFYKQAYIEGKIDARKEIAKLKMKLYENNTIKDEEIKEELMMLGLKVEVYFETMNKTIKSLLLTQSIKKIENAGGFKVWLIDKLKDAIKKQRTNLITFAGSGYSKGRNDEFADNKEVEMFEYTAVMDINTCENCAPYDGLVMTREEIEQSGLNFPNTNGNLNPDCLGLAGDNVCRCLLIPIK